MTPADRRLQELAFALASAVAYLRALESAGIALDEARGMIYARLSADADQFLTLAKFRALRLLWARVEQACGLTPKPLVHRRRNRMADADPARPLREHAARHHRDIFRGPRRRRRDLRAAAYAGAGLARCFARRVARNTQLVLLEESNLAKVADPAAGSGGIETLTQQLCEAAWALFQEIEKSRRRCSPRSSRT